MFSKPVALLVLLLFFKAQAEVVPTPPGEEPLPGGTQIQRVETHDAQQEPEPEPSILAVSAATDSSGYQSLGLRSELRITQDFVGSLEFYRSSPASGAYAIPTLSLGARYKITPLLELSAHSQIKQVDTLVNQQSLGFGVRRQLGSWSLALNPEIAQLSFAQTVEGESEHRAQIQALGAELMYYSPGGWGGGFYIAGYQYRGEIKEFLDEDIESLFVPVVNESLYGLARYRAQLIGEYSWRSWYFRGSFERSLALLYDQVTHTYETTASHPIQDNLGLQLGIGRLDLVAPFEYGPIYYTSAELTYSWY